MLPVGFALLFGYVWLKNHLYDTCQTINYVLTLSIFSSLFAKTGRIYLLFSNKSLQLVKYTDRDVGLCVGVLLVGEIVVLGVMTGLQPAEFVFQTEGDNQFSFCMYHLPTGVTLLVYNVSGPNAISTRCESHRLPQGIIIVFGIIIAALVGKLRLTLYNEAKYIGLAVSTARYSIIDILTDCICLCFRCTTLP
jgi:hypothetical protein